MIDIDLEALEREIADMTEDGKAFTRLVAGALLATIHANHGKPQAQ